MLRDRIVCGINDDTIQKRLLAEVKLTYAKALELAQGLETAARNVKEISCKKETASPYTLTRNGQQEVYKVTPERKAKLSCYHCGKAGHVASKCRFKGAKCHKCGKTGHLQRVCHSKPKDGGKRNSFSQPCGGGRRVLPAQVEIPTVYTTTESDAGVGGLPSGNGNGGSLVFGLRSHI